MEIITANELLSGSSVWVDANGNWQMDLSSARLFGADESVERDAIIAKANASGRLVGVLTEHVAVVDGKVVADRLRERIRAEGPTAPYGPERQTLGEDGHVSL